MELYQIRLYPRGDCNVFRPNDFKVFSAKNDLQNLTQIYEKPGG